MKKIFQWAYGWPVLLLALILGFGGAALSAVYKNHWFFIIGFAIDLLLVIGFIVTCDEEGEPSEIMQHSIVKEEGQLEEGSSSTTNEPTQQESTEPNANSTPDTNTT